MQIYQENSCCIHHFPQTLCSTEICHKLSIHFKDEDQSDLITQALPECHSYTDKKAVCFNEV